MSSTEWAIIAINGAARAAGTSYGKFVVRATAEELEEIIRSFRPPKKRKK